MVINAEKSCLISAQAQCKRVVRPRRCCVARQLSIIASAGGGCRGGMGQEAPSEPNHPPEDEFMDRSHLQAGGDDQRGKKRPVSALPRPRWGFANVAGAHSSRNCPRSSARTAGTGSQLSVRGGAGEVLTACLCSQAAAESAGREALLQQARREAGRYGAGANMCRQLPVLQAR
jgi:hypothetical protein